MTKLEQEVLSIYEEIAALDTDEKRFRALTSWWAYLQATCTEKNPCVECLREKEGKGA